MLDAVASELAAREILTSIASGVLASWVRRQARDIEAVRAVSTRRRARSRGTTVLLLVEVSHHAVTGAAVDLLRAGTVASRHTRGGCASPEDWPVPGGRDGVLTRRAGADNRRPARRLAAIARTIATRDGRIRASATTAFAEARGPDPAAPPVRRGSAEQSNSAVLYGDRLILKVIRRLEPGLNPDLEIGRFLSDRTDSIACRGTPAPSSTSGRGPSRRRWRSSRAWSPTRGPAGSTPWPSWPRITAASPAPAHRRRGGRRGPLPAGRRRRRHAPGRRAGDRRDLRSAATLGRRTAELHLALASDRTTRPSPGAPDRGRPHGPGAGRPRGRSRRIRRAAGAAGRPLRAGRPPGRAGPGGRRPASWICSRSCRPSRRARPGSASTAHYHLGQVLRDGDDYVILDFEGEPARPLERRREKYSR
jgi:maltose alpha-D-glucosyltransferase/alpha-amylase